MTLIQKRKRPAESLLLGAVYASALFSALLLAGAAGYVFYRGSGSLSPDFFLSVSNRRKGTVGIGGNLVNTLYVTGLTLAFAVPAGVGAAVYLNEYAVPGRPVRLAEFAVETLAGVPSVIFGLFGYTFFGNVLGLRYTLLNGALTLSLMVLPLIIRNTQEALRAVPESYRSGALGLGATRLQMIRTVLLPAAAPGIRTGVILAVGRVTGESAALLFTAGSAGGLLRAGEGPAGWLRSLFDKVIRPGGTLTVEMYLQMQEGRYEAAFGIGCVLMAAVFLLNALSRLIGGRSREK